MSEEPRPDAHTRVIAFGLTDPGRVRTNNEDTFLIAPLHSAESSATPSELTTFTTPEIVTCTTEQM